MIDALKSRGTESVPDTLREEVQSLIHRWAQRRFEDSFGEIEAFEIRCAEEQDLHLAEASGSREKILEATERAFRQQISKRYGQIEIRGLQLSERVVQKLETAYVPLYLEDPSKRRVIKAGKDLELREIPRRSVIQVLSDHESVLVVGGPGSGKTTLISYLAAQVADAGLTLEEGKVEQRVPLVVPVRSLKSGRMDEVSIAETAECDRELLGSVLKQGRALLLVDGIDEAAGNGSSTLLDDLRALMVAYPGNRLLVTSRPSGLPGGQSAEIEGLVSARLLAMTPEEVNDFIDRWCLAAELSVQKEPTKAREDARLASEDLKRRVHMSQAVEQLAETPLLCTILCVVHRFLGQRIPERRAALYDTCTNVLLYEWDRAKFPEGAFIGKLDVHAKRRILSAVARAMHEAKQAEMGVEEIVQRFAGLLPSLGGKKDEAAQIIDEIRDRSGLLVERRSGYFAFSHLTFQEYLTATDYVREGAYAELLTHADDMWWDEVIMLASGIPGADAARLVDALLQMDGAQTGRATLLAARCVDTAIELPQSLRAEIERRLEKMIPPRTNAEVRLLSTFGSLIGPVLLKALVSPQQIGRESIAATLGLIGYEPACSALAQLMSDPTLISFRVGVRIGALGVLDPLREVVVGEIAAFVLLDMAIHSATAKNSLKAGFMSATERARRVVEFFSEVKATNSERLREAARYAAGRTPVIKSGSEGKRRSKRGARSA